MTIAVDDTWARKIKENVVTKRLNLTNLDPRNRIGAIVTKSVYPNPERQWESVQVPGVGIIVERSIQEKAEQITYSIHLADGTHKGVNIDYADLLKAE